MVMSLFLDFAVGLLNRSRICVTFAKKKSKMIPVSLFIENNELLHDALFHQLWDSASHIVHSGLENIIC